jgi:hypothetical protein
MIDFDPGTNTLTWNSGEEVVAVFQKLNIGTVTSPTVQLYKGSQDVTSTYTSGSASVSNDGTTMIFTTPKFLNTLPPNTYKLHLKGTVDSLIKDLHTMSLIVLKRGN